MIPRYHFGGGGIISLGRKTLGSSQPIRRSHLLPRDAGGPGQGNTYGHEAEPWGPSLPLLPGDGAVQPVRRKRDTGRSAELVEEEAPSALHPLFRDRAMRALPRDREAVGDVESGFATEP